jgi:eukaryotic translation initiation factor 2C
MVSYSTSVLQRTTKLPQKPGITRRELELTSSCYSQGAGVGQLNPNVQTTEDATVKPTKELSLESLKLNSSFPRRPGYGTQGKKITLCANYFELTPPKDLLLYRYSVEHLSGIDGKKLVGKKGKWVVKLLLQLHFAQSLDDIVTDYRYVTPILKVGTIRLMLTLNSNTIISTSELPLPQNIFEVQYRSEEDDIPRPGAKIHRLQIEPTKGHSILQLSELMDYLTSSNMSAVFFAKNELIQALNIIVGFQPKINPSVLSIGANKHYPIDGSREFRNLGAGLEALRGYLVSVRAATSRLLVNVQVKHAASYEAGPLGHLIQLYTNANGPNLYKLEKFVKRLRVQVTHIIRKNAAGQNIARIKTIFGFATSQDGRNLPNPPIVPTFGSGSNNVQFFLGGPTDATDGGSKGPSKQTPAKRGKKPAKPSGPQQAGEYITVANFFKRTYNKVIQDPKLPVINVGNRQNPSYLPVDVCIVVPGQPSNAKLSPAQTQQMISFAVRKPAQNATSITTNGVQVLGIGAQPNASLRRFNLSVSSSLITVPGRVLNGPNVQYRNSKQASTRFGSWNMQSIQFSSPATLPTWSYMWISSQGSRDMWVDHNELKSTMDLFRANLKANGLNADAFVSPGLRISINGGPQDGTIIETGFNQFLGHPKKPTMMLVILPYADTAIYNQVKCLGDVKKGLHTICVVATKFAKQTHDNNAQYFANVALKFNLKLGGVNQTLDAAKIGVLGEGKTMVVGLDVTHPSPGSADSAPSVAGIVATVDKALGQWPADVRIQTSRQEMVDNLDDMFVSRLRLWQAKNKALPENILMYRDGVSEGQYQTVLDVELPQIQEACKKMYPATSTKKGIPYISIIVVGKRHHTRFYPTKAADADRSSNPQNGTIVDRGVTEARNWDFFLQAHTALQGTARPAHYYVIYDEIFRNRRAQYPHQNAADALEDLTHNLCYLFGRATKAVSICPAAYYADLVCERARCYLSEIFDATPAASVADSGAGGEPLPDPDAVKIHQNLKDTMFYI